MTLVRIIKGPSTSKVIGWVCEVLNEQPSHSLAAFLTRFTQQDMLKLRTCDETLHPEGYFFVYASNTEVVEG